MRGFGTMTSVVRSAMIARRQHRGWVPPRSWLGRGEGDKRGPETPKLGAPLPGVDDAVIDGEELVFYALDPSSERGGHKTFKATLGLFLTVCWFSFNPRGLGHGHELVGHSRATLTPFCTNPG
jgi:hypothetical protein